MSSLKDVTSHLLIKIDDGGELLTETSTGEKKECYVSENHTDECVIYFCDDSVIFSPEYQGQVGDEVFDIDDEGEIIYNIKRLIFFFEERGIPIRIAKNRFNTRNSIFQIRENTEWKLLSEIDPEESSSVKLIKENIDYVRIHFTQKSQFFE